MKVHVLVALQTRLALLPRIIVAVVLVLTLLSGIVSFSSASAGHFCTMACCAGLPQHAADSCHMSVSSHGKMGDENISEPEPDELCGIANADGELIKGLAGVMGMKESAAASLDLDSVTIDASDHCDKKSTPAGVNSSSENDSSQPVSIAAQFFSKPCPPECGTGALNAGVRPLRDTATVNHNARPRAPTLVEKHRNFNRKVLIVFHYCNHVRPRGPPFSFS
jgi:hypothetical protein